MYADADKMREIADRPNTTVFETKYDATHDPWPASRLRPMMERLAVRVTSFGDEVDDFTVRKTCLDDTEFLCFQRAHPKFYWMLTDREMVAQDKVRQTVAALIELRSKVERGELRDGDEANAAATAAVMAALTPQSTPCTPG